jgi:PBSX family phage terminase large subunit
MKLLPQQYRFMYSRARYRLYVGGVGAGKTLAGALLAIDAAFGRGESGTIVAPTYPMLKDATMLTFFDLVYGSVYLKGIQQYNKQDHTLLLYNGARITFRSGEHPDRLRGPNLTWAWLDEAALMKKQVWMVTVGRLRVGNRRAWATTTPAGFNWVWEHWVDRQRSDYELFRASTRENIYLPEGYVRDLEDTYSEEYSAQEIDGEFVAFEGLVYKEFRHAIHVTDDDPPPGHTRVRGIDFGYTNPFVCLWAAVDEDGRVLIYDEHYEAGQLLSYHSARIKERTDAYRWTVADHDAQDAAELASWGIYTNPAKKDVTTGIQRVKEYLQVKGDGRPRLRIHKRCKNTLREMASYRWQEVKNGAPREVPAKEDDHAMDVIRYILAELNGPRVRKVNVRGI